VVGDEFLFGDMSFRCWNVIWKETCKNLNKTTTQQPKITNKQTDKNCRDLLIPIVTFDVGSDISEL